MELDDEARQLLAQMEGPGFRPPDFARMSEIETAEYLRTVRTDEVAEQAAAVYGAVEEVASVEDLLVTGPAGKLPLRVYTPEGSGPFPVVLFIHGGGWVMGKLAMDDPICRSLANAVGCAVVSPDYRLAPEHPFPAALDDCHAAAEWAAASAADIGADGARLAVMGASAGGNLAAAVALRARDEKGPVVRFQALIYPCLDSSMSEASYEENALGPVVGRDQMGWYWRLYLTGSAAHATHPHASPTFADDLRGLPPALVVTVGCDPLRDEGESYARRLQEAGVPTVLKRYDGQFHGFAYMRSVLSDARRAFDEVTLALRAALASEFAVAQRGRRDVSVPRGV